ncbi:hypothetical protein MMC30_008033 [Trapelia coarctata]|nr:hypothetical protein [Trapelia coarctata]
MSTPLRTSAALRPISSAARNRSGYICLQCRRHPELNLLSSTARSIPSISRRDASTSQDKTTLYTEKLRRKIWGTDNPPGQADPYGNDSVFFPSKQPGKEQEPEPETVDTNAVAPALDVDYIPATTWDGLDHIGGAAGWWEAAWDEENQFQGFMPATVLGPNDAVERAIRRAVIEVHTLREAAQPLTHACKISTEGEVDLSDIKFSAKKGDAFAIVFGKADRRHELLDSVGKENNSGKGIAILSTMQGSAGASVEIDEREAVKTSDEFILGDSSVPKSIGAPELKTVNDGTWLAVSLQEPTLKFAILKRTMQLVGKRIPDSVIAKIHVVQDLVDHLTEILKPKKLAEQLITQPVATMPNVEIFPRRHTPIDKEKEVGRWKVIERELQKRGLPVTGRV